MSNGHPSDLSFNGSPVKVLSYPNDVAYNDGHYILFKIFEKPGVNYESPYVDVNLPSQISNQAKILATGASTKKTQQVRAEIERYNNAKINKFRYGSEFSAARSPRYSVFQGKGKAAKNYLKGNICLYTPPTVNVTYKATYEEENISGIGALVSSLGEVWKGATGDRGFWDAVGDEGTALGRKAIGSMGDLAGTGGAQQALFGTAVNRNFADVIFTGVSFRTFTFEYVFMPANPQEANDVAQIIEMFHYYAMPIRRQDTAMTYELPAEFELRYMYYNKRNKYIQPALALALESVDIKYGGEKFATFRGNEDGAQPVRTDLTLTFRELEIADRHSIYGDEVPTELDDRVRAAAHTSAPDNIVKSDFSLD